MKYFIKKTLAILIIFTVIVVFLSIILINIHYNLSVVKINESSIDSTDILILGDSRADRHINPSILNEITSKNCLNIAESSLDLYSLSLRLSKVNLKNKILIISASSWQINDGSTEDGYFRIEAFNDLNDYQKVRLYLSNLIAFKEILYHDFPHNNSLEIKIGRNDRFINDGYNNINCNIFDTLNIFRNHPWYRRINTRGIKAELLSRALVNLNKLDVNKIIIYNGPVYPGFKIRAMKNGIWEMENEYCNILSSIIVDKKLKKLVFYDLRCMKNLSINDFYDPQHLCKSGSIKFTRQIANIFNLVLYNL